MHTLHTIRNIFNSAQNRHNLCNNSMDSNHTIWLSDIYYES